MKLLLVCGPWSSGTSVVAGLLSKLGATGFGPYFITYDQRTGNSYESVAFRKLVQTFASEQSLSLRPGIDVKAQLRKFHDCIVNQELGYYDAKSDTPIFLKYPPSALVIQQICEVFETRLVMGVVTHDMSGFSGREPSLYCGSFASIKPTIRIAHNDRLYARFADREKSPKHSMNAPEILANMNFASGF